MKKLITMTVCLLAVLPVMSRADNFQADGSMAIPMLLFTGAGLQGSGNGTGIGYSFGQDGGDVYQTFSYDFMRPRQLLGRKVRMQAVWLAPISWWGADAFNFEEEENPALGAQAAIILYEGHLVPGTPGSDPDIGLPGYSNPPKLPTTIALFIGANFNLEYEEPQIHVGLSLVRFLF